MSGIENLDITTSALLVIDMQNAFCHPEGTLGQSGLDTDRLGSIIPAVLETVEDCQAAGMPVIWTLQEHFENDRRRARKRLPAHTSKRKGVSAGAGSWDTIKPSSARADRAAWPGSSPRPARPATRGPRMKCSGLSNAARNLFSRLI